MARPPPAVQVLASKAERLALFRKLAVSGRLLPFKVSFLAGDTSATSTELWDASAVFQPATSLTDTFQAVQRKMCEQVSVWRAAGNMSDMFTAHNKKFSACPPTRGCKQYYMIIML